MVNESYRNKLHCGHQIGWMFRLRNDKEVRKYCWGCVFEKINMPQVGEVKEEKTKKSTKK